MKVSLEFDTENYDTLSGMLSERHAGQGRAQLPSINVSLDVVGETGATVCSTGLYTIKQMGLGELDLLPTSLTLFTADRKSLTVLGAIPEFIRTLTVGGRSEVSPIEFLYVVEELKSTSARTLWCR